MVGLVLAASGCALAIGSAPRRQVLRPAVGLAAAAALLAVFFIPAARLTYIQREIAVSRRADRALRGQRGVG